MPQSPIAMHGFDAAGELAWVLGDYAAARSLYERSLAVARDLEDWSGMATALRKLYVLASTRGAYVVAHQYGEESLAILAVHQDPPGLPSVLRALGMNSYLADDQAHARQLLERSLAVAHQAGDARLILEANYGPALVHHVTGQYQVARQHYELCVAIDRSQGHRGSQAAVLSSLGHLAALRGDYDDSREQLRASLITSRDGGDRRRLAFTLSTVAGLLALVGEPARALRLDAAGRAALDLLGAPLAPAMRRLYDGTLASARRRLTHWEATTAETFGQILPLDEAVDEALAWLAEPAERHTTASHSAEQQDGSVPRAIAPGGPAGVPAADHPTLTRREREVAILIARGCSNRQIAEALVLTEGTAANHVRRVLGRLGLQNRAQVAAWAVEHGLHERSSGPDPHADASTTVRSRTTWAERRSEGASPPSKWSSFPPDRRSPADLC